MRHLSLLLGLLCGANFLVSAQTTWQQRATLPGLPPEAIAVGACGELIATVPRGVYLSTDDGATWELAFDATETQHSRLLIQTSQPFGPLIIADGKTYGDIFAFEAACGSDLDTAFVEVTRYSDGNCRSYYDDRAYRLDGRVVTLETRGSIRTPAVTAVRYQRLEGTSWTDAADVQPTSESVLGYTFAGIDETDGQFRFDAIEVGPRSFPRLSFTVPSPTGLSGAPLFATHPTEDNTGTLTVADADASTGRLTLADFDLDARTWSYRPTDISGAVAVLPKGAYGISVETASTVYYVSDLRTERPEPRLDVAGLEVTSINAAVTQATGTDADGRTYRIDADGRHEVGFRDLPGRIDELLALADGDVLARSAGTWWRVSAKQNTPPTVTDLNAPLEARVDTVGAYVYAQLYSKAGTQLVARDANSTQTLATWNTRTTVDLQGGGETRVVRIDSVNVGLRDGRLFDLPAELQVPAIRIEGTDTLLVSEEVVVWRKRDGTREEFEVAHGTYQFTQEAFGRPGQLIFDEWTTGGAPLRDEHRTHAIELSTGEVTTTYSSFLQPVQVGEAILFESSKRYTPRPVGSKLLRVPGSESLSLPTTALQPVGRYCGITGYATPGYGPAVEHWTHNRSELIIAAAGEIYATGLACAGVATDTAVVDSVLAIGSVLFGETVTAVGQIIYAPVDAALPCRRTGYRVQLTSSLDETAIADVRLSPNPSYGQVSLTGATAAFGAVPTVEVYGVDGRRLRSERLAADERIDLGGLPAGIYAVSVRTADAARTYRVVLR